VEEKDREIWIGENRFYLGEDNILYETIVGEIDEKTALASKNATIKMRSKVEGKLNVLIDLTRAGKPTPEARKIGQEELERERVGKVALFGMHPVARVIASFVMGISKKKDMRFFKTKKEALAWVKK